ncbi:unnamed protein product, partial [Symbiodinium necroappetens]
DFAGFSWQSAADEKAKFVHPEAKDTINGTCFICRMKYFRIREGDMCVDCHAMPPLVQLLRQEPEPKRKPPAKRSSSSSECKAADPKKPARKPKAKAAQVLSPKKKPACKPRVTEVACPEKSLVRKPEVAKVAARKRRGEEVASPKVAARKRRGEEAAQKVPARKPRVEEAASFQKELTRKPNVPEVASAKQKAKPASKPSVKEEGASSVTEANVGPVTTVPVKLRCLVWRGAHSFAMVKATGKRPLLTALQKAKQLREMLASLPKSSRGNHDKRDARRLVRDPSRSQ